MLVRQSKNASLIEIHAFSDKPKEAAEIANAITQNYAAYPQNDAGEIEIVDRATPPSRPVRPNKLLSIAIGTLGGIVLGALAGLATTFILRRKHPPEVAAPPAPSTSDRFWKRFAIAVALILLGLILIPVFAILLAIGFPTFERRDAPQPRTNVPVRLPTSPRFSKTVVLTEATNHVIDASNNLHSVFVKTDTLMLPGESLVQLTKQSDGQMIETHPGFFIHRNPDPKSIRTSSIFTWVFQSPFGSNEVDFAVAQLIKNKIERPLALIADEPLQLFCVTNKFGAVQTGYLELKRSIPKPLDDLNATIKASVKLHSYAGWPSINYSADVPPGYELQATANMGDIHLSRGPSSIETTDAMWIPRSPFSVTGTIEQMNALRADQNAQLEKLLKQGTIEVVLGQPRLLFSLTNSNHEVFQAFFELIGPNDFSDALEAKAKLAELRVEYTDDHPEVKAQLALLHELQRMTKEQPNASPALREAKAKLAKARVEFTDTHPEVRKLIERVRVLEGK